MGWSGMGVLVGGGDQFDISIFGDEPRGNYNRILLSGVLSGTHSEENIFINPLEWYEKNNVTLYAGVRAIGIDRKAQTIYAAGGNLVPYDKLVIATGSVPFVPPMDGLYDEDGAFRPGLFVFRTLDDCVQMIEHTTDARRAVVIGEGLLGLEAAQGLLNHGLEVHVVHLAAYLMESQLDSLAGDLLKGSLEDMGVTFHLEKVTTTVLGEERVTGIRFKDDSEMPCDMVVISAGIMGGMLGDKAGIRAGLKGRVFFLGVALLLEGFALLLFSQMASLVLAVGAMIVFSLFVQMSEGATFSVVPFINRRALGSVAGIVGAGGNAGAVSFGFLFRMESLETQGALMIVGLVVIAASALVFLVRFSPARESEEHQAIQSALASRHMVGSRAEAAGE